MLQYLKNKLYKKSQISMFDKVIKKCLNNSYGSKYNPANKSS